MLSRLVFVLVFITNLGDTLFGLSSIVVQKVWLSCLSTRTPLVIALGFGDRAYPTISGDGMFNFGRLAVLPENELGVTSRSYLV